MSNRKYVKYVGAKLSPGDIVNLNGDGVPYIYEGLEEKTNFYPLCASNVDALPRYDSCAEFLSAHGRASDVIRSEYQVKDYSAENIPVSTFDKIYINPFEELVEGDIVIMNGKKFINTGLSGTATHLLSAIPKKFVDSASQINLGSNFSVADNTIVTTNTGTTPEPETGTGTNPTAPPAPTPSVTPVPVAVSLPVQPDPTPTPTPTSIYTTTQAPVGGNDGGY